jgi:iron(III) transport system permease protein
LQRRLTLLLAVFTLVVVGVLPLAAILAASVHVDGSVTLSIYQKVFADPARHWVPAAHSLALATLTASCAALLGVPLGLLLAKTDMPFRRLLAAMLAVPLVIPPYILAISWFNLVTGNGLLGRIVSSETARQLPTWLFGLPGCVWVLVSALMPAVMLLTMVGAAALNPRLEEAGRLVAPWSAVLCRITLPSILPAILFATLLVFLLALGEVGVPMFLRYRVFPVETLTQFAAFYDAGAAAAAAMPLLAVPLLILALERRYLREQTYRLQAFNPGKAMLLVPLGRLRVPALLAVSLVAVLTVVIPLAALTGSSLSPLAYGEAWSKAGGSLVRSLTLAAVGATLLMVLGFLCGYLIHYRALRVWRAVDTLTLLLFTVPGPVTGVGLIALWNRPGASFVYGSAVVVILAYLAQYTALTSRITLALLATVPASLEEAAQTTGAPWSARIGHVVVPGILPGLAAGWLIGFIFCLRDLGASMLVYPPGQDTLPVRIFTLMANGAPSLISALCMILVLVALVSLAILTSLFAAARSSP